MSENPDSNPGPDGPALGDSTFQLCGKTVRVTVNLPLADKCLAATGCDLLDSTEQGKSLTLLSDPRLSATLVHMCSDWDQSEEGAISFAEHWTGETITEGVVALWAAIALFSPSHLRRPIEAAFIQSAGMAQQVADKAVELIESGKVEKATIEAMEQMAKEFEEAMFVNSPGKSQGS